ncbi:recombinase family protein [Rubinisphaera sp.]|uniref:recombinase family protein n=1 Tax=Rubinisphaera sp. TaxID=2024857 RepID=UPI0025EA70D1|nr:recombinase family protein [Rubinisphaera sp.]
MDPSTDRAAVDAVQFAFQAVQDGYRIADVYEEFKRRNLKTSMGNPFRYDGVQRILQNPIYTGRTISGRFSNGKFSRIDDEGLIITEDTHPALVTVDQFDDVQSILRRKKQHQVTTAAGTFLLSGLIRCGTCGCSFHCSHAVNGSGEMNDYYRCSGSHPDKKTKCVHPTVTAADLEREVLKAVKNHLLTDENLKRCWAAYANPEATINLAGQFEDKIVELKAMIATGQKNLILATRPEDFAVISDQLQDWKSELRGLQRQSVDQQSSNPGIEPLSLEKLRECRDSIELADRKLIAVALAKVIDQIIVTRIYSSTRQRITTAKVLFHPDSYFGEPIEISDQELTRRPWRIMAQWIIDQKRLVSLKEISKNFKTTQSNVSNRLGRAVQCGLLQKVQGKGWADGEMELNQTQWRDVAAWVQSRKNPTTIDHVMKRFELHRGLANAHLRYGVQNDLLKKIGNQHWVDIKSELKSTGYEDILGWVIEQDRICSVAETAEEFGIKQSQVRSYFAKAVEKKNLAHHPRRGWASLTADIPFVTADDVEDYCHEKRGHFDVGEICDVFEIKPGQVYKIMRKLVAKGVVTKDEETGWNHITTV